jgi:hypothetical protein
MGAGGTSLAKLQAFREIGLLANPNKEAQVKQFVFKIGCQTPEQALGLLLVYSICWAVV